jgi:hypothetical protein
VIHSLLHNSETDAAILAANEIPEDAIIADLGSATSSASGDSLGDVPMDDIDTDDNDIKEPTPQRSSCASSTEVSHYEDAMLSRTPSSSHIALMSEPVPSTTADVALAGPILTLSAITETVLKPCLSIIKQDLPKYDYDLYIAVWAVLRMKGIHGRCFEVAIKKLLVTDET